MTSDLEKTYSREQQRLGNEVELGATTTTPQSYVDNVGQEEHSHRSRIRGDEEDIEAHKEPEKDNDYEESTPPLDSPASTNEEAGAGLDRRTIIRFEDDDPAQPNNWSRKRKFYAIFVAVLTVMNSTMSSSLAAGATQEISQHFGETNETRLILPTSIYLVGYTCGPLIWGPLSESYGRKWPSIIAFAMFTIFSVASALSPNFAALVVFRWLVGVGGSCALSVVGGICADVYHDPTARGRSMAYFMAATTCGPIFGPPVSGFISKVSWSWTFWIGAILAVATWPFLLMFPETYAPVILKYRARRLRRETGDANIVAPIELEKTDLGHIITVVLTRPFRMILTEPLVYFTCLYTSYAYAIFYIFFQSYPIIFTGIYGFNAGEEGLTFIAIGIGAFASAGIYLAWDKLLLRAQKLQKPWSRSEEMRRLPLACFAGPFFVVSLFWAGWTARKDVHWIVPALSGIPFGIGYLCLFMALLNYLVDAYEIFAASAMAASSFTRSTFGAVLPFAAKPMYRALGVPWACSLLGFFSLALLAVPFVFLRFGARIRSRSKFCQYLAAKKRKEQEEKERRTDGQKEGCSRKEEGDGVEKDIEKGL